MIALASLYWTGVPDQKVWRDHDRAFQLFTDAYRSGSNHNYVKNLFTLYLSSEGAYHNAEDAL